MMHRLGIGLSFVVWLSVCLSLSVICVWIEGLGDGFNGMVFHLHNSLLYNLTTNDLIPAVYYD